MIYLLILPSLFLAAWVVLAYAEKRAVTVLYWKMSRMCDRRREQAIAQLHINDELRDSLKLAEQCLEKEIEYRFYTVDRPRLSFMSYPGGTRFESEAVLELTGAVVTHRVAAEELLHDKHMATIRHGLTLKLAEFLMDKTVLVK